MLAQSVLPCPDSPWSAAAIEATSIKLPRAPVYDKKRGLLQVPGGAILFEPPESVLIHILVVGNGHSLAKARGNKTKVDSQLTKLAKSLQWELNRASEEDFQLRRDINRANRLSVMSQFRVLVPAASWPAAAEKLAAIRGVEIKRADSILTETKELELRKQAEDMAAKNARRLAREFADSHGLVLKMSNVVSESSCVMSGASTLGPQSFEALSVETSNIALPSGVRQVGISGNCLLSICCQQR